MKLHVPLLAALAAAVFAPAIFGADDSQLNLPVGYTVPAITLSPNKQYGVTAYDDTNNPPPSGEIEPNKVIDMKTGRVVAVIDAAPAMTRMNNAEILAVKWSPHGSLMLWHVDDNWCPWALVLLDIDGGKLRWQTDLLKVVDKEILVRTQKAAPDKYAAAKQANAGNGSAYPDGFTIDVMVDGKISPPIHVTAALTSNPKQIPTIPELDSHLDGYVDGNGKFAVKNFSLGPGKSSHF